MPTDKEHSLAVSGAPGRFNSAECVFVLLQLSMKGKKLASFFLLVVVLEMLLLSASDATPFWRRRRSRRRYRWRPAAAPPCSSYKPFNSVNNWNQHFSFFCPNCKQSVFQFLDIISTATLLEFSKPRI